MGDPRYVLGMDFIDMYKNEVGASEPKEDFYDRHDMYSMWVTTHGARVEISTLTFSSRTDIVVAAICPEWFKLIETWVITLLRRVTGHRPRYSSPKLGRKEICARCWLNFPMVLTILRQRPRASYLRAQSMVATHERALAVTSTGSFTRGFKPWDKSYMASSVIRIERLHAFISIYPKQTLRNILCLSTKRETTEAVKELSKICLKATVVKMQSIGLPH